MNKKQRATYIMELATNPNPSLDDLLGVIGWDTDCSPEERAEADRLTAEWIRKDRENRLKEAKSHSQKINVIAEAS